MPIYLDNQSSTRLDPPRDRGDANPISPRQFGNPHSASHGLWPGWPAEAIEQARDEVARADQWPIPREGDIHVGRPPKRTILAIKGAARFLRAGIRRDGQPRDHIVTLATEHKMRAGRAAASSNTRAFTVTYLPVESSGLVSLDAPDGGTHRGGPCWSRWMAAHKRDRGHPSRSRKIGELCCSRGVLLHTDAAQALRQDLRFDVEAMHIDLMSIFRPQGLWTEGESARSTSGGGRRVRLLPLIDGGGQGARTCAREPCRRRSASGWVCAAAIAAGRDEQAKAARLRQSPGIGCRPGSLGASPGLRLNGDAERRLPGQPQFLLPRDTGVAS